MLPILLSPQSDTDPLASIPFQAFALPAALVRDAKSVETAVFLQVPGMRKQAIVLAPQHPAYQTLTAAVQERVKAMGGAVLDLTCEGHWSVRYTYLNVQGWSLEAAASLVLLWTKYSTLDEEPILREQAEKSLRARIETDDALPLPVKHRLLAAVGTESVFTVEDTYLTTRTRLIRTAVFRRSGTMATRAAYAMLRELQGETPPSNTGSLLLPWGELSLDVRQRFLRMTEDVIQAMPTPSEHDAKSPAFCECIRQIVQMVEGSSPAYAREFELIRSL